MAKYTTRGAKKQEQQKLLYANRGRSPGGHPFVREIHSRCGFG
jgi:hypothetical protein